MIQLLFSAIISVASFSKSEFFKVISSNDAAGLTKMIDKIQKINQSSDQMAYLGTLKMKKAEYLKTPKDKLAVFKEGKELLEKAILKNNKNAEYRFLRLIIQENAPKVLKYNANIKEDVKVVSSEYLSFTSEVKSAVVNYSKTSASLKI
jgi:hypothetical protein